MFSNGSLLDEYCQLNSIFSHFECKSVSYDDTNNISWRINSCYSHYYLLRLLMMHGIISVHLKTTYTCWQYIVLNIVIKHLYMHVLGHITICNGIHLQYHYTQSSRSLISGYIIPRAFLN